MSVLPFINCFFLIILNFKLLVFSTGFLNQVKNNNFGLQFQINNYFFLQRDGSSPPAKVSQACTYTRNILKELILMQASTRPQHDGIYGNLMISFYYIHTVTEYLGGYRFVMLIFLVCKCLSKTLWWLQECTLLWLVTLVLYRTTKIFVCLNEQIPYLWINWIICCWSDIKYYQMDESSICLVFLFLKVHSSIRFVNKRVFIKAKWSY